ncbi:uncharacterized protein NPIL_558471, partial [Nephila pilipes]
KSFDNEESTSEETKLSTFPTLLDTSSINEKTHGSSQDIAPESNLERNKFVTEAVEIHTSLNGAISETSSTLNIIDSSDISTGINNVAHDVSESEEGNKSTELNLETENSETEGGNNSPYEFNESVATLGVTDDSDQNKDPSEFHEVSVNLATDSEDYSVHDSETVISDISNENIFTDSLINTASNESGKETTNSMDETSSALESETSQSNLDKFINTLNVMKVDEPLNNLSVNTNDNTVTEMVTKSTNLVELDSSEYNTSEDNVNPSIDTKQVHSTTFSNIIDHVFDVTNAFSDTAIPSYPTSEEINSDETSQFSTTVTNDASASSQTSVKITMTDSDEATTSSEILTHQSTELLHDTDQSNTENLYNPNNASFDVNESVIFETVSENFKDVNTHTISSFNSDYDDSSKKISDSPDQEENVTENTKNSTNISTSIEIDLFEKSTNLSTDGERDDSILSSIPSEHIKNDTSLNDADYITLESEEDQFHQIFEHSTHNFEQPIKTEINHSTSSVENESMISQTVSSNLSNNESYPKDDDLVVKENLLHNDYEINMANNLTTTDEQNFVSVTSTVTQAYDSSAEETVHPDEDIINITSVHSENTSVSLEYSESQKSDLHAVEHIENLNNTSSPDLVSILNKENSNSKDQTNENEHIIETFIDNEPSIRDSFSSETNSPMQFQFSTIISSADEGTTTNINHNDEELHSSSNKNDEFHDDENAEVPTTNETHPLKPVTFDHSVEESFDAEEILPSESVSLIQRNETNFDEVASNQEDNYENLSNSEFGNGDPLFETTTASALDSSTVYNEPHNENIPITQSSDSYDKSTVKIEIL